ncbi:hypothetical protein LBMAG41_13570 [Cyanobium sp.]|nr:hypothetical protein LBMAG41_13570 [Cyanobium sp.]
MAINDALLARLGQVRGTGEVDAIFKSLGQSEILNAMKRECLFERFVKTRNIKRGKSAEFQITGRATAAYVTPGVPLLGGLGGNSPSDKNVKTIAVDGLMAADQAIYSLDELMDYADVRSEYFEQLGIALAWERDKRIARILFAAANSTTEPLARTINTGRIGFKKTLTAGYATASKQAKGDELASALGDIKVAMRKKDVPASTLVCVVPPDEYDCLNEGTRVINTDFNGGQSNGSIASGAVGRVKGIPIYESNHLIQPPYTLSAFDKNPDYAQDLTKLRALVFSREAVGMLTLRAPKFQMTSKDGDFDIQYQATLGVATQSIGIGRLRDECAACIVIP